VSIVCRVCVMDSTDPSITFNSDGICSHCINFRKYVLPSWNYGEGHDKALDKMLSKLKSDGETKPYDCILGLSGGVDSSFMLHLAIKEFGLRPLVFHVDAGWNSRVAVNNIFKLVDKLEVDLQTTVIDWPQLRDFQLSYFKSGLPNLDVPQDHMFVATLYKYAEEHGIRYILNGGNFATEGVRNPLKFMYYGTDMRQINAIKRLYAESSWDALPFSSVMRHKFYLRFVKGIKVWKPLDLIRYDKGSAIKVLQSEYGWEAYSQKHFESRFTAFYEGFWLRERFGFDTRKIQLSSLILSKQMDRSKALTVLESDPLSENEKTDLRKFVADKLEISETQLMKYFEMPKRYHTDYPNSEWVFNLGGRVLRAIGAEKSLKK